jgi:carboxyl-terminal processing protease
MKRRSWPWLAGIVIASGCCFFLLSSRFLPSAASSAPDHRGFQLLGTVIQLIKYDYVEEPDPAKTMDGAFRGLVDSLDVLSSYLDPVQAAKYAQAQKTPLRDAGLVIIKAYGGFPEVVGLTPNSPAEKAGLAPGDLISSIDNRSTFGLSLVETRLALKSPTAGTMRLKVLRRNQTLFPTMERGLPAPEPVAFFPAAGTAGVLQVLRLQAPAADQANRTLGARLKDPKRPLVVDLRNCAEGDIEEARRFLNLFLKTDKAGVFQKRQGPPEPLACPEKAAWDQVPLVIWTNVGTQGPAEMVAGVLQDFKRAKVVGLNTAGLTASTRLLSLEDGSALLLTSGVFVLNSGKKLWGQGVKPDSEVAFTDTGRALYLKKTLELLSSR